jgi:hypothetical protein
MFNPLIAPVLRQRSEGHSEKEQFCTAILNKDNVFDHAAITNIKVIRARACSNTRQSKTIARLTHGSDLQEFGNLMEFALG